jgi:hypothetical protein
MRVSKSRIVNDLSLRYGDDDKLRYMSIHRAVFSRGSEK